MKNKILVLNNEEGLHARSAALFVRVANRYSSDIVLKAHGEKVNGKSIIGIMSLGVFIGVEIEIIAEGVDEEDAVEALSKLIEENFVMV